MKCYAFDVDHTLEISGGPVTLQSMMDLRNECHIVGLCGNWGLFCQVVLGWHHIVSFVNCSAVFNQGGVVVGDKTWWLGHFKQYVKAEEYIMVGNIFGERNSLGLICESRDNEAAEQAGWRFIKEDLFAAGER